MDFPSFLSLTITNACNLRCRMCGQWSEEGYIRQGAGPQRGRMRLEDWKRVVDEAADHGVTSLLIRGGEPFLYPGIIELLHHIESRGMEISIDSNGTVLDRFASDLVGIAKLHITVSMDGPEPIHDEVRGVAGTYQKVKRGLERIAELERDRDTRISTSLTLTISPYSYRGLGALPDVARQLGVDTVCIVPYYYVPDQVGRQYERELKELGCAAFSWHGFHHEESGVDFDLFQEQYRKYLDSLGELHDFPYLPLAEEEYRTWFADAVTQVGPRSCGSVERLIDIQPNGDANFCVDFPDYVIGNVCEDSIEQLWNGERARRFREYRRRDPLAVCLRCGAKYMADLPT